MSTALIGRLNMARFRSVLFVMSMVGLSSACSTFDSSYDDGPAVFGGTQTGLGVRYDPAKTQPADIDQVAITFCRAYDKKPIRRSKSVLLPNVVYQAYDCVAPVAGSTPATSDTPATTPENASPATR